MTTRPSRLLAIAILALTGMNATARSDDLPPIKDGLWQMTNTVEGMKKGIEFRVCLDEATRKYLLEPSRHAGHGCTGAPAHFEGNVMRFEMTCSEPVESTSSGTIEVIGDSEIHASVAGHFAKPVMGKTDTKATMLAKWAGACPAGLAPGELIGPRGVKLRYTDKGAVPVGK